MRIFGENLSGPLTHETPFGNITGKVDRGRKTFSSTRSLVAERLRASQYQRVCVMQKEGTRGSPFWFKLAIQCCPSEHELNKDILFVLKKVFDWKKIESQVFKTTKCQAVKWILPGLKVLTRPWRKSRGLKSEQLIPCFDWEICKRRAQKFVVNKNFWLEQLRDRMVSAPGAVASWHETQLWVSVLNSSIDKQQHRSKSSLNYAGIRNSNKGPKTLLLSQIID